MEKLTITAAMATPFVTGGGYMTFDALLAGLLFDRLQDVDAAHAAVPVQCSDGLFHASAAFYEPIDRSRASFVASLRADHSLDADLFPRKRDGSLYKQIGTKRRRDFGNVMNAYDSIYCDRIQWHVEGDGAKIQSLLQPVTFIGKRRASGFGQVDKWSVDEGELDGLIGVMREPLRPIPEDRYEGDKGAVRVDAAWRPPYWHPANRAICYAPDK